MRTIAKIFFYYDIDIEIENCIKEAICGKGMAITLTNYPNEYEIRDIRGDMGEESPMYLDHSGQWKMKER